MKMTVPSSPSKWRSSGAEMSKDLRHILIELREPLEPSLVYQRLATLGLGTAEPSVRTDDKTARRAHEHKINNTSTRFWFRLSKGMSIESLDVGDVERALGVPINWIAPAYRPGPGETEQDMSSPLPNALLIRFDKSHSLKRQTEILNTLQDLGLREDTSKSQYLAPFRYFVIDDIERINAYQVKDILARQDSALDVRFETMPISKPTTTTPNDTLYLDQWNMDIIRAGALGLSGWSLSMGDRNVVICILDAGCDLGHPDLSFVNNGINLGTMSGMGAPTGNHGTACAGIAAATINNSLGVAGLAGQCLILPVAFQNWTDVEVAAGINYAADNGADVISMSFGQYDTSDGLAPSGWDFGIIDPAIEHAFELGLVLVAATGNENINSCNRYPARHPLVMAIGASDENDNRKSPSSPDGEQWGSNFADGVSVVAPGVHIPTTDRRGTSGYNTASGAAGDYYARFNGTSSATPHVAGLAALIRWLCPSNSNQDTISIIERTADKVGSSAYTTQSGYPNGTRNQAMGYGRINVDAALREAFLYSLACLT